MTCLPRPAGSLSVNVELDLLSPFDILYLHVLLGARAAIAQLVVCNCISPP